MGNGLPSRLDHQSRALVVGDQKLFGLCSSQSFEPPGYQPQGVGVADGKGLRVDDGSWASGRCLVARLGGDSPKDCIDEPANLAPPQPAGDSHGRLDRGVAGNPVQVEELNDPQSEHVEDVIADAAEPSFDEGPEMVVELTPLPKDPCRQLVGQSAILWF